MLPADIVTWLEMLELDSTGEIPELDIDSEDVVTWLEVLEKLDELEEDVA